jgi:nicotinamidase-related amidase
MEGKVLPVKHCIENTDGWEISKELDTSIASDIIDKPNFGYVNWVSYLSDFKELEGEDSWLPLVEECPENIELVGLCTDICVVSNALILKAIYPETNITVDASCCAGVTPESHNAALTTMKMCQINVIGE